MARRIGPGTASDLLANPRVRAWHEARALRSRLSADTDLRKLRLTLHRLALDADSVVKLAAENPDALGERLVRYASEMKRSGKVDDYISKTFTGLGSYLRFRRVAFDGFPAMNPIRGSTLGQERVPTPEELGRILDILSLRGRLIALLMAHTGVRPQVIGNYTGDRGLTLGDLPELDLKEMRFSEAPFVLRVPAELSKTRAAYTTFGTDQLAAALLSYLRARRDAGERFTGASPLVSPRSARDLRGAVRDSRSAVENLRRFLVTAVVVRELKGALTTVLPTGVRWRPYVLRSYCSTRLLLAEGQGRISRDLREALLGHNGGIASRYHVGKRWGEELLAEARREYANASEFLEGSGAARSNIAVEFRRTLLGVAGVPEAEVLAHLGDSNEELLALLRQRLIEGVPETETAPPKKRTQRPVTLQEAERLLAEGWTYVSTFGSARVLLQAP